MKYYIGNKEECVRIFKIIGRICYVLKVGRVLVFFCRGEVDIRVIGMRFVSIFRNFYIIECIELKLS